MKELLTYIVQNLVDHPDQVSVTERASGGETVFEVRVADGDMGKVIGRQGRIVKEKRDSDPHAGCRPETGQESISRYHGLNGKGCHPAALKPFFKGGLL